MKIIFKMKEIFDNIISRRSVRAYKPDAVPSEAIERIIEAGLYAPSGMNRQETVIVEISDKPTRDRLAKANAAVMGSDRDPFYGAPTVLVVLAKRECPTAVYDGSLVMGNMMLAAHALGLGSCWIHRAKEVFDTPEWKAWLASLGIEGDFVGIGNCIIGYPCGEYPAEKERRSGRVYRSK